MESETSYLYGPLANTCFNFNSQNTRENECRTANRNIERFRADLNRTAYRALLECVVCVIKSLEDPIPSNCSKDFDCFILRFANNTLFENFFANHSYKLPRLFKDPDESIDPQLIIFVEFYNITMITGQYIESYLKMNALHVKIHILFLEHPKNSSALTVYNETYSLNVKQLQISQCDNSSSTSYFIKPANEFIDVEENKLCPILRSSEYVSFVK